MKGMGPFSLFGSRLDSGACCQPEAQERRPRLFYEWCQRKYTVRRFCAWLAKAYSNFSTSWEGSDAVWSASGSERSRTMYILCSRPCRRT